MSECECNQSVDRKCGVCDEKCGTKKKYCREHDYFMICGECGFTCDSCKQKGLEYVSGQGGHPYIYNNNDEKSYFLDDMTKPYINYFK